MFLNILENLSGVLDQPHVHLKCFSLIPAKCSGCGPGFRSPLDAMKGEMLLW